MKKYLFTFLSIVLAVVSVVGFSIESAKAALPKPVITSVTTTKISTTANTTIYKIEWKTENTSRIALQTSTIGGISVTNKDTGYQVNSSIELPSPGSITLEIKNYLSSAQNVDILLDPLPLNFEAITDYRKTVALSIAGSTVSPVLKDVSLRYDFVDSYITLIGENFSTSASNTVSFEAVSNQNGTYGIRNFKIASSSTRLGFHVPRSMFTSSESTFGTKEILVTPGTYQIVVANEMGKSLPVKLEIASSSRCYTFLEDLYEGSTGLGVQSLQNHLISNGYAPNGLDMRIFGPDTTLALKAFQARFWLPNVGYVSYHSRDYLNSNRFCIPIFGTTTQPDEPAKTACLDLLTNLGVGITSKDVLALNRLLTANRYLVDDTETFNARTSDAVRLFQTDVGLPATGYVGPLTRDFLKKVTRCNTPVNMPFDIVPVQAEALRNDWTTANNVGRFLFKFKITAKDQNVYLLTRASDFGKAGVMYTHAVNAGTATWNAALVAEKVGNDTATYFTIPKGTTRQFSVLVAATKDSIPGLVNVTLDGLLARIGSPTNEVSEYSFGSGYTTKYILLPSEIVSSDSIIFENRKVDYQITSINTATSYFKGEMISFKDLKAIKSLEGNSIPTPAEGYNIQSYITDANDPNPKASLDGINAEYNTTKSSWSGVFAKELPVGDYYLDTTLYCSNSSKGCPSNGYQDTVRVKFSVKSNISTISVVPTVVSARAALGDPVKNRLGTVVGYSYQMALKLVNNSDTDIYINNAGQGLDTVAVISPSTASVNYSRDAYPIYVSGDVSGSALIIPAGTSRLLNYAGYFLTNDPKTTEVTYKITGIHYGTSASSAMKSVLTEGLDGLKFTAKLTAPVTPTAIISAYLMSASSDTVGSGFGKGVGISNQNPYDWAFRMTTQTIPKDIESMILKSNTSGEFWSTSDNRYYPLHVVGKGYENTKYGQIIPASAGSVLDLYAQPETTPFAGGTLVIKFVDGTTKEVNIPASKITQGPAITPYPTASPSPSTYVSPTPTPVAVSGISIISPYSGQVMTVGNTYKIAWTGTFSGNDSFMISYFSTYEKGALVESITQAQANCSGIGKLTCSYTWKPATASSKYQIAVSDLRGSSSIPGYSGVFSIATPVTASPSPSTYVSPTPTPAANPSVTFVSPVAGQALTAGQTSKVVWSGNWTGNDVFNIMVVDEVNGKNLLVSNLTQSQANCSGVGQLTCSYTYTWTSRSVSTRNQFVLSLKRDVEYTAYSGWFTVNANVSSSPSSTVSPTASPVSVSNVINNASIWSGVKSLFGF